MTVDTLRPLPQFLGVNPNFCFAAGAFTPPANHLDKSTVEKLRSRIYLNLAFFLSNYALLTAGAGLVVSLSHPRMVFSMGAVAGLWWLHFLITEKGLDRIIISGQDLSTIITPAIRFHIVLAISLVVGVFQCLVPLLSWFFISMFLVLTHAVLRDPKHIEKSASFRLKSGAAEDDDESDDEDNGLKAKLMEGATITQRRQDVV